LRTQRWSADRRTTARALPARRRSRRPLRRIVARSARRQASVALPERRLGERFVNEPAVRVAVEGGVDHLLGRGDREIGELLPQIRDRAVALELDLVAGAGEGRVGIGLSLRSGFGLNAVCDFLRLGDEALGIAPGGLNLIVELAVRLGRFRL